MTYRLLAALVPMILLTGCSGIKVSEYAKVPLEPATVQPGEADLQRQGRAKVIVMAGDDNRWPRARQAQAGDQLTHDIEQKLASNGIELLDRGISKTLEEEIRAVEMSGTGPVATPSAAHYAVRPAIVLAEYTTDFVPARSETDKKGKTRTTPASYTYRVKVDVGVKVYGIEFPSLRLIKVASGQDSQTITAERPEPDGVEERMIRKATRNALKDVMTTEFVNLFPARAYITGKLEHDGQAVYSISIGSGQGIEEGLKANLYTVQESLDPFTRKPVQTRVLTGTGKVRAVQASEAFIEPDDKSRTSRTRLGDPVEILRKGSIWPF